MIFYENVIDRFDWWWTYTDKVENQIAEKKGF
jgi:hypothetical protein